MGLEVPAEDLPGSVPTSDLPGEVDTAKYGNSPISTFAANAVNALTFGLPDYLNKKFTPQQYAEAQKYVAANPGAANAGTAVGEVAGFALPTGYGAVKGAQLGVKGAGMLAERFAPKLPDLAKLYGQSQGGITGATMGAQAGSALPGIIQGDPGRAVAAPALVNQYANKIPMINHLGGVTGDIVPAVAGVLATKQQQEKEQAKAVLQQPPTAQNFIERMRALSTLYRPVGE